MLSNEVKPQWMVLFRHFGMEGGVLDFGVGHILGFYDSFKEADDFAKWYFEDRQEGLVDPRVWVMRCEKTYVKAKEGNACIVSKEEHQ